MSIRRKILIPMIILTVVCSAVVFASSIWLFNRGLNDAAYSRINLAAMSAEHELNGFIMSSQMAAVIVAENYDIIEAVKNNNHEQVLAAANSIPAVQQVDFCTILDIEGRVIARTHEPDNYGGSLLYQYNISHALEGEITSTIERGTAVLLSVRTGAPIVNENGEIVGVVSLGYRFDTQDFVAMLKSITDCDITLFLDDLRISTTINDSSGEYAVGTKATGDTVRILSSVYDGKPYIGSTKIDGVNMVSSYNPIYGKENEVVGVLAVLSNKDDDMGRIEAFLLNGIVICTLLLISAVIIAIFISNTIDHRINTMMERVRETEKLEAALDNAEKANKAKSAFLANMSHEIRTPMNVILGLTEMQLRDKTISEESKDRLEKVFDSGKQLLNIVNDILDHSKIEAGKLEIVPIEYNVPRLISDAVLLNRMRYDSKPVEFILDVSPDTPSSLFGDELRIKQILNNIISNAFKYTDKGEIHMTVHTETLDSENVLLVISVSDTGLGMTEEQLDKLFTEYMRFNTDVDRMDIGTGLGLSITKHIVELMGGKIKVTSSIDEGSVFTISFPQKRVNDLVCGEETVAKLHKFKYRNTEASRIDQTQCQSMPDGHILIVDDVRSNIYVIKSMLQPYGLQTDTAHSGFEALDKVEAGNNYDIIFMDHMMPKMNGIEATRRLRNLGYTGCIIALTANAIVGQAEIFLSNGFDGYISKPIDSRELDNALRKYINRREDQ